MASVSCFQSPGCGRSRWCPISCASVYEAACLRGVLFWTDAVIVLYGLIVIVLSLGLWCASSWSRLYRRFDCFEVSASV